MFSVRTANPASVVPGLLVAVAILYTIRQIKLPRTSERIRPRLRVRAVLTGRLGRALALLILRATDVLAPERGGQLAAQLGIALYLLCTVAATSIP